MPRLKGGNILKKKIFPIVLMVIGIGLIALGLISTNKILDKTKKPKKLEGYDIKETSTLTTCIDENCEYKGRFICRYII